MNLEPIHINTLIRADVSIPPMDIFWARYKAILYKLRSGQTTFSELEENLASYSGILHFVSINGTELLSYLYSMRMDKLISIAYKDASKGSGIDNIDYITLDLID